MVFMTNLLHRRDFTILTCLSLVSIFFSISNRYDDKFSKDVFDYVVVGGGTAGLAVASRLSENQDITVLVLEAGGSGINNTGISIPGCMGTTIRSPVDWNYSTLALEHANNRSFIYPRGKVLGGSSAINFMAATKASRADYDILEKLGNGGWGWSEFDRASKKSEKLLHPQPAGNFTFVARNHGTDGPLKTSFPKFVPEAHLNYFVAAQESGHSDPMLDGFGPEIQGPARIVSTISENAERVTSATAYYHPIASSRPNLVVRLDSEVNRLLTSKSKDGKVLVNAVRYTSQGLEKQVIVSKEVILSAGSIGSPAILERSGMGDPSVLTKLGIPIVNILPGVGSNLVDHPMFWSVYRLRQGVQSADDLLTNMTFAAEQLELYQNRREGILTHAVSILDFERLSSFLKKEEIAEGLHHLRNHSRVDPPWWTRHMMNAIEEQIFGGTPIEFILANHRSVDMLPSPNASYISLVIALQYPLSRGTSHISSPDPSKSPLINLGYFEHPFDLWLLAKAAKHARKLMSHPIWSNDISGEHLPGLHVKSDEEWREHIKDNCQTVYHPIGTAAMLPQDHQGVVDQDLRVYGTKNLRVIDASIIPVQLAMHPQISIYAIAEMGAEKVLEHKSSLN